MSQVFLKDPEPCRIIAEECVARGVNRVVEIGPGGGVLTKELLGAGLHVTAVEADERFAGFLPTQFIGAIDEGRLNVVHADAMQFDFLSWLTDPAFEEQDAAVVGNLPYHLSTPIFQRCLDLYLNAESRKTLKTLLFLVQKEFGERVCSAHDCRSYGSLSVYAQLRSSPQLVAHVSRLFFEPQPNVDSVIVALDPLEEIESQDALAKTEKLCRHLFSLRRKMLRSSLKPFLHGKKLDLDLTQRPENLTPEELHSLAGVLFRTV